MYLNKNKTKKKKKTLRNKTKDKKENIIFNNLTLDWAPSTQRVKKHQRLAQRGVWQTEIFYGKNGLSVLGQRWQIQEG